MDSFNQNVIRDQHLSLSAKGLYFFFETQPRVEGGGFVYDPLMEKFDPDELASALQELVDAGYIEVGEDNVYRLRGKRP